MARSVGQAMKRLGIEMIPAYSPEARGRSERMFRAHQDRLPKELAAQGITEMAAANRYLRQTYLPAFNAEFIQPAREEGAAFGPWIAGELDDFLCEAHERVVGKDNCVAFAGIKLQIPPDRHRCHYLKVRVRVHRYADGRLSLFHGPRCLARYDAQGRLAPPDLEAARRSAARGRATEWDSSICCQHVSLAGPQGPNLSKDCRADLILRWSP